MNEKYRQFIGKEVYIPGEDKLTGVLVDIRELWQLPGHEAGIIRHPLSPVDAPINLKVLRVRGNDGTLQSLDEYLAAQ